MYIYIYIYIYMYVDRCIDGYVDEFVGRQIWVDMDGLSILYYQTCLL